MQELDDRKLIVLIPFQLLRLRRSRKDGRAGRINKKDGRKYPFS